MKDQPLDRLAEDGIVAERVCYYAALYPQLREVARQHGYALALHGSLTKDLDLLAVPWTECATSGEHLVAAIAESAGALISKGARAEKPHGRMAWTVLLAAGGGYIDLSVMPRAEAPLCDLCGPTFVGLCSHGGRAP